MLKTQVEEISPSKVTLTVEVEVDRVRRAFESFFQRAARAVSVPGFRKGNIPRSVLLKHIGTEAIQEQVTQELLKEVYPVAVKEAGLQPVSMFRLKESSLKEGSPFTFKAELEIKPKLAHFNHTGFEVAVPCVIVDDADVNRVLDQLKDRYSKTAPVETGTLEIGDFFLGNIQVAVDGQPDKELSEDRGYKRFTEQNPMLLPMKGMAQGETRTFSYQVVKDVEKNSKHFGKTLDITVKLEGITRVIPAQINDDFAREVGDFASLDALKAKIRDDLERHSREQSEEKAYDSLLKKISDGFPSFEIPEAMIQNSIDLFLAGIDQRWRQFGTSIQEYLKKSNQDIRDFRETFREKAKNQARIMLIVEAIGDRENLDPTDSEYRSELEKRAAAERKAVDKLLEELSRDDGEGDFRFSIRNRKIREFLLKNNNVRYDMVKEADLNKGEPQGDAGTDSN